MFAVVVVLTLRFMPLCIVTVTALLISLDPEKPPSAAPYLFVQAEYKAFDSRPICHEIIWPRAFDDF